jgi:hypothetical protein
MAASAPPVIRRAVVTLSVGQRGTHGEFLRTPQRLKDKGSPSVGVCCALMETVTERLPLGLATMNLLYSPECVEGEFSEGRGIKSHL